MRSATVSSSVSIRAASWSGRQNSDVLRTAVEVLDRNPAANVHNLAVVVSPKGRRTTLKFRLEETI